MSQTIYHIYAQGECIYHSIKEEEFNTIWTELSRLAQILSNSSELSYEKLTVDKELTLNSSH